MPPNRRTELRQFPEGLAGRWLPQDPGRRPDHVSGKAVSDNLLDLRAHDRVVDPLDLAALQAGNDQLQALAPPIHANMVSFVTIGARTEKRPHRALGARNALRSAAVVAIPGFDAYAH